MEKTEKTAEEIVSKNDIDKGPPHWVTKKSAIKSCEEYAAQELDAYKVRLKDKIRNDLSIKLSDADKFIELIDKL